MNCEQAKQIPLSGILDRLGHEKHHQLRGELWYKSPLRTEAEPSFKIYPDRNIWYDFGEGKGGNVLDFIMEYFSFASISEALRQLERLTGSRRIEQIAPQPSRKRTSPRPIDIIKIQPIANTVLIAYLKERGIPVATARPYLKEIYYTRQGKSYFALAFGNESGGYELRNRYYKGTHGHKSISLVKKSKAFDSEAVTVFEGFFDFLSALTYYGRQEASTPVVVMNSAMMKEQTVEVIRSLGVSKVYLYMQHDEQGIKARDHITKSLIKPKVLDKSDLYTGYKDFNDFWVETHQS